MTKAHVEMGPLHILVLLILIEVLGQKPTNGHTCADGATPSHTQVSGTKAPTHFCQGELIFVDEFDNLDLETWQHENTLSGAGNWEFQWYTNNRSNSYVTSGHLFIRPSLLADQFGEDFLSEGTLDLNYARLPGDECTKAEFSGCERTGTPKEILNPIKSASISTYNSFSFRYGKVEVKAMMAAGDWLWSAIWMAPTFSAYGDWPASGEIDIAMSRGNRYLMENGIYTGIEQVSSMLHFGPYPEVNMGDNATFIYNQPWGFDNFIRYQMWWTPDFITFSIDDVELGTIKPPKEGFWEYGNFSSYNIDNPWKGGSKMAPFDQKFYINMNLACGGTSGYFKDDNKTQKPWIDDSPSPMKDFWDARSQWLPTWNLKNNDPRSGSFSGMIVDYIKVWAL